LNARPQVKAGITDSKLFGRFLGDKARDLVKNFAEFMPHFG
jgi:hypothetical protein